ncbi:lipopolysaccharide/colanic/teichoic acid biosynthesis glycosyltransferase [Alkalispirillum mobile]|uniref:Lipopolysaccharide/colanic/teichoic acid biosynthesis glycosyltransferase n=1 Tax=Alkalispirillum mobile TaxID=85925 RepID=A0A498C087_9GAMM|nr:sugar transferase [Alkalispirillum mobile]RLK48367.1 lipopolysaccharide/colanic/teichoic acid biosynthesis glycosyltransferase [Alkalispirillum mobile]
MLKRGFDVVAAALGLLLLMPLLLGIALWIKLDSPGPVFFRQVRVGRHGKPFRIFKFRTMRPASEAAGKLTVGEDARITHSGRLLRRYKLDELPQLLDVLRGTMSLVGPRPEVPEYVAYYQADVKEVVLSVRPGLTDYAALEMLDENTILARYSDPHQAYVDVVLPQKLAWYQEYVARQSLKEDIRIILRTLYRLASSR